MDSFLNFILCIDNDRRRQNAEEELEQLKSIIDEIYFTLLPYKGENDDIDKCLSLLEKDENDN